MATGDMGALIGLTEADLQIETIQDDRPSPRTQSPNAHDGTPTAESEACFYPLGTSKEARNSQEICETGLAALQNASKSQVADDSAKSSIRSAHIRSTRSSTSLRAKGQEQQRARTDYLQAQGCTLASSKTSISTGASMDNNVVALGSGVEVVKQELRFSQAPDESSISVIHNLQESVHEEIEVANSANISACGSSLEEAEMPVNAPGRLQSALTTCEPSRRFKMRRTFRAARALEAGNWFEGPGRGSQTLPLPRRFPIYEAVPEDAYGLPPSCGNGASVLNEFKFWRLPRSTSLRMRNDRLPPAYIQPADRDLLVESAGVGVSGRRSDEFVKRILESVSPLARMGAAPLIPDPDEDDNAVSEPSTIDTRASHGRRSHADGKPRTSDFTVDTIMTDALHNQEAISSGSRRKSRSSTNSEEVDVGERPPIPIMSPNRPSRRNSVMPTSNRNSEYSTKPEEVDAGERPPIPMLSPNRPSVRKNVMTTLNQNSAIWPVPEPVDPLTPREQVAKPISVAENGRLWWKDCLLAAIWAIATALTLFGISGISPLYQPAACTRKEIQTRLAPSFSFTHSLQLTVALPEVLRPVFPILRRQNVQGINLMDHGLKVEVEANDDSRSQKVIGGLTVGSSFSDGGEALVCDVTYAAVINDDGAGGGRRKLKHVMDDASYKSVKAVEVVLARIVSRELKESVSSVQAAHVFLPLWLACLLALEMILPIHFVALKLLWAAVAHLFQCCRPKKSEQIFVEKEEDNWRQEVLATSALTCRWVLAGAMGSAVAGGILVAFWA